MRLKECLVECSWRIVDFRGQTEGDKEWIFFRKDGQHPGTSSRVVVLAFGAQENVGQVAV